MTLTCTLSVSPGPEGGDVGAQHLRVQGVQGVHRGPSSSDRGRRGLPLRGSGPPGPARRGRAATLHSARPAAARKPAGLRRTPTRPAPRAGAVRRVERPGGERGEQVGPAGGGALERAVAAPPGDRGMVAAAQHGGHRVPAPRLRAGVAGPSSSPSENESCSAEAALPSTRAAAGRPPRPSPAPRPRRRRARSRRCSPRRPAPARGVVDRRAGRCPRSGRRRRPGAPRAPTPARWPG